MTMTKMDHAEWEVRDLIDHAEYTMRLAEDARRAIQQNDGVKAIDLLKTAQENAGRIAFKTTQALRYLDA